MPIGVSIGLPKYHIASSFPLNTACVPFLFFSSLQSCLYGGCSVQTHSFQLLGALTRRTPTRCGGHFGKLPTRVYTRRKLRLHFRTARMVETRPQPANCLSNFISEDIHRAVGTCWLGVTGRWRGDVTPAGDKRLQRRRGAPGINMHYTYVGTENEAPLDVKTKYIFCAPWKCCAL